jgi:hypothetical protein
LVGGDGIESLLEKTPDLEVQKWERKKSVCDSGEESNLAIPPKKKDWWWVEIHMVGTPPPPDSQIKKSCGRKACQKARIESETPSDLSLSTLSHSSPPIVTRSLFSIEDRH